ncbi:MAG: MOSC domain-containing protein [Gammaproteobacteria bacterium]|nr:MOSC domain-containing protein [Gammaproteobacteria bacterium]
MAEVSIFIGDVKPLPVSGRPTGIYKTRVSAPIAIGTEGFQGDAQADRRVHGGPDKAVHLYPTRHYARLADEFPQVAADLVPGSIGENLATAALDEADVRVGDVWQLGTALLQVSQPRSPCWKIDERYGCDGMAKFIAASGLTGWYWRVLQPGMVAPGDPLDLLEPAADAPTLREAMQLCSAHRPPVQQLERLASVPGIAGNWRDKIVQRIAWLRAEA